MVALLLRFLFFPFQAVECLPRRTSALVVGKEATEVLVAGDHEGLGSTSQRFKGTLNTSFGDQSRKPVES